MRPAEATPRTSLAAHVSVYARCAKCERETKLDIQALIEAGFGDNPCAIYRCGARTVPEQGIGSRLRRMANGQA